MVLRNRLQSHQVQLTMLQYTGSHEATSVVDYRICGLGDLEANPPAGLSVPWLCPSGELRPSSILHQAVYSSGGLTTHLHSQNFRFGCHIQLFDLSRLDLLFLDSRIVHAYTTVLMCMDVNAYYIHYIQGLGIPGSREASGVADDRICGLGDLEANPPAGRGPQHLYRFTQREVAKRGID